MKQKSSTGVAEEDNIGFCVTGSFTVEGTKCDNEVMYRIAGDKCERNMDNSLRGYVMRRFRERSRYMLTKLVKNDIEKWGRREWQTKILERYMLQREQILGTSQTAVQTGTVFWRKN